MADGDDVVGVRVVLGDIGDGLRCLLGLLLVHWLLLIEMLLVLVGDWGVWRGRGLS